MNTTEPKNSNGTIVTTIVIIILLVIGFFAFGKSKEEKNENQMMQDSGEMTSEEKTEGAMMEKEEGAMMEKTDTMMSDEKTSMNSDAMMMTSGSYEAYSLDKLAMAEKGDVVLFFRASWCPTCRALDSDIKSNMKNIPEDLTILDVDYDNSKDLKQKYGVTYQHTLVQVDKDGNLIKKWSGSPTLSELVKEVS